MSDRANFLLQVEVRSGSQPAPEIPIGESSNKRAAFIDDKNDTVLVVVDFSSAWKIDSVSKTRNSEIFLLINMSTTCNMFQKGFNHGPIYERVDLVAFLITHDEG